MLGRLARWLRVLGYDTHYARDIEDSRALALCRSEGRILLTRDNALLRSLRGPGLLLESDDTGEQLRQVVAAYALNTERHRFTRCLECNCLLAAAAREQVAGRVPPYVFKAALQFSECPACGRLYWPGSHRRNMERRLRAMLGT